MIKPVAILALILGNGIAAADDDNHWPLEVGKDPDSYEEVLFVSRLSQSAIQDESARKDVFPRLMFQCNAGQGSGIDAKIDWQRFISSFNTEISFKVDNKDRLWLKFGVDRSNKITAAKSPADGGALIDYLSDGELLTVGVTPYSESAVSVIFELAGFIDSIAALHLECGG